MLLLIGKVFNKDIGFEKISELNKIDSRIYILDNSEIGIVLKHKSGIFNLSDNTVVLGRSGFIEVAGFRIAYLNGEENKKFLSEFDSYNYTGCFYSRDDIDLLLNEKEESKVDILLLNTIPSIIYDELIK
jgi:hypothetical protein